MVEVRTSQDMYVRSIRNDLFRIEIPHNYFIKQKTKTVQQIVKSGRQRFLFFRGHMVWLLSTVYGNYMITNLSYSEVKGVYITHLLGFIQASITSDNSKMVAGEGEIDGVFQMRNESK